MHWGCALLLALAAGAPSASGIEPVHVTFGNSGSEELVLYWDGAWDSGARTGVIGAQLPAPTLTRRAPGRPQRAAADRHDQAGRATIDQKLGRAQLDSQGA